MEFVVLVLLVVAWSVFRAWWRNRSNDALMASAGMVRIGDAYYSREDAEEVRLVGVMRQQRALIERGFPTPELLNAFDSAFEAERATRLGGRHSPAPTHILDTARSCETGGNPLAYKLVAKCGVNLMTPVGGHSWIRDLSAVPPDSIEDICTDCFIAQELVGSQLL